MNIRPCQLSDHIAVVELFRLNTPAYFACEEEDDLVGYLARDAQHYFVVENGGRIIACGGYNLPGDGTARISWDIVHPEEQGKGVGSLLTEFRIAALRKTPGVSRIVVRTSQLACRFYERFGFALTAVEKNYWAKGFDLYRMEMEAGRTGGTFRGTDT